jgi:hypothetical protein
MGREVAATFLPHPAPGMQQFISEESPEETMKPTCPSMKLSMIAAPEAITVVKAALFAGILTANRMRLAVYLASLQVRQKLNMVAS